MKIAFSKHQHPMINACTHSRLTKNLRDIWMNLVCKHPESFSFLLITWLFTIHFVMTWFQSDFRKHEISEIHILFLHSAIVSPWKYLGSCCIKHYFHSIWVDTLGSDSSVSLWISGSFMISYSQQLNTANLELCLQPGSPGSASFLLSLSLPLDSGTLYNICPSIKCNFISQFEYAVLVLECWCNKI